MAGLDIVHMFHLMIFWDSSELTICSFDQKISLIRNRIVIPALYLICILAHLLTKRYNKSNIFNLSSILLYIMTV